jgi:flagellar biosynthesis protein FlhG
VGKTNISVNLAVHLAQQGYRTCLFDADLGLANINILLGIYPEHNLEDVIDGRKEISEIIVREKSGIDVIPGSSGVAKMEALTAQQLNSLAAAFGRLEDYDYLVFDTSAGISKNVIAFCMNASEVLLVITPEPTSLTDAYALMKVLSLNGFKQTAKVVVNQSKNPKTAQIAYTKLKDTVLKFLGIELVPLGTIVSDARVIEAVAAQKPFITLYPNTQAAKGLKSIAANLLEKIEASDRVFALDTFWQRCVDILTVPLKLPPKKGNESRQKQAPTVPAATGPLPKPAAAPAQPPAAGIAQTPIQGDETTRRLLEQLVEKVSAVSQELSGIRTALEQGALAGSGTGGSSGSTEKPPIIPLDFEAFLAAQESGDDK